MTNNEKALELVQKCLDDWPYAATRVSDIMRRLEQVKALLKEQEPRRVKSGKAYGQKFYFCPRCARPLEKSVALGNPRYCGDCGQGLIWE